MSCRFCNQVEKVKQRVKTRGRAFAAQVMVRNAARKNKLQGKTPKVIV